MRPLPLTCLILASSISSLLADTYTSTSTGLWDAANTATWTPAGSPQTGTSDSVLITGGHVVTFSGANGVGLSGSGDLGVANNQSITIDGGGVLTQTPSNFWIRIGHASNGTLNIKDGRFHFTNTATVNNPNLQIGIRGASGFVNIGDGTGAAGSAVLNLRDIVDGTANAANVSMNLGVAEGTFANGVSGTVVINSDGVLEGDLRNGSTNNPVIRIGQISSAEQSSITINAGGQFRAHGTVELGSNAGANGLIRINGADARMDMDHGELNVGYFGTGTLIVENGGTFSRVNTTAERMDLRIGREANSTGSIIVQSGGQFLRGTEGNVGDMRIGQFGTGSLTINAGGLVQNDSGNWDWVGQENGGNGTLTVNTDGTFRTTAGANLVVGANAGSTGLVLMNGGSMSLESTTSGEIRIGQNGNGTFRQIDGMTSIRALSMAENSGTAAFDLKGGMMNVRAQFFLGGLNGTSTGTGTATATQSGGTLSIGGAFVMGLAPGHTGSFSLTGGEIFHTGSDTTVGENGTGSLHVGINGKLTDTSGGGFLVGRNEGSTGTLIVDGTLSRTAASGIRVGNGNTAGVDNTTAPGLLGGTGTITSNVTVGSHGTLTGGNLSSVGTLTLEGTVNFSTGGLLFANFAGGNADRINVLGTINLGSGAILDGEWTGGPVSTADRYWLMVNTGIGATLGSFGNVSLTSPNASLFPDANAWATIDGQEFAVFYGANFDTNAFTGGNDILLAPVPEPGAALLVGCGAMLGLIRRRRRSVN